jgi:FKBP12-rapamycin complex-associated protein
MFLLKGHEDLRQDERAMQLFGLVNTLLANDNDTETKNLFIKRFPVIPLSHNTGIIGWVPKCDTLHQLIKEYRTTNKIIQNVEHRLIFTICPKFETAAFLNKLEVFKYALQNTLGLDLYKILWKKSKNSEAWLDRRTNYSRSLAVMSMVGYILGLGDRHPSNLMLDRNSGKIIHIDFGDCFEVAMKRERFPERVPFRLTRMLIKALEVSGIEGTFRITCEHVMRVLRANKDSLIAILTAFVHDPLISFRLLIPLILKATRVRRHVNAEEKITSESLRKDRPDEIKAIKTKSLNPQPKLKIDFEAGDGYEESEPRRRKMGSTERQLYNLFEERGIHNYFNTFR